MKICYLCPDSGVALSKFNGSAAHVRGIVRGFVELGHDVELVMAATDGTEELGLPVSRISQPPFVRALSGLVPNDVPEKHRADIVTTLRALRRIWLNEPVERSLDQLCRERRPDLVYERHSPFGVAGSVVARRLRVPHVLEVNAPLAWEGAQHRGQVLNDGAAALERLAFAAATTIVAVSDELKAVLVADGVAADKIVVVPNGVDPDAFDGDGVPRIVSSDSVMVGFVGSLKAWHGIEVLVAAFEQTRHAPALHLLVVGDGPLAPQVRALGERLPERVTLTGAVDPRRVPGYLKSMDIAVAPYPPSEPFYFSPVKILEYMASGTAVVASSIGQVPRLLEDGRTGLLVPAGDVGALAGALDRLAGDAPLRRALGERAREEVRARHTWRQRVEEILGACGVAA